MEHLRRSFTYCTTTDKNTGFYAHDIGAIAQLHGRAHAIDVNFGAQKMPQNQF